MCRSVVVFSALGLVACRSREAAPVPRPMAEATAETTASCQAAPSTRTNVVTLHHRLLSDGDPKIVRREQKRDVWIHIVDANRLVYMYAPGATPLAEDRATRAAFESLMQVVGPMDERTARPGDRPPADLFRELANAVLQLAVDLRDAIKRTDDDTECPATAIAREQKQLEGKITKRKLDLLIGDTALVLDELRERFQRIPDSLKPRLQALNRAATAATPAVVSWWREFQLAAGGREELLYEYPGSGDYLVELTVANRLGASYRPARFVGSGADVALVQRTFPTFQVSFGLAGLFGDRVEAELVKVSATASTADTFEVRRHTVGRFSILPSTYFSVQRGIRQSPVTLGGALGVGLRGDELEDVGQATDLMGVATVGYDWIRASVGLAYTSEITGFTGTFARTGADSSRAFTTDPNALQRTDRTRKGRWVFAIHMTR